MGAPDQPGRPICVFSFSAYFFFLAAFFAGFFAAFFLAATDTHLRSTWIKSWLIVIPCRQSVLSRSLISG
jgi:hypothetical protein